MTTPSVHSKPITEPRSLDVKHYHVFLASPGDVQSERKAVREYFDSYNVHYASPRGLSFDVVDWENFSTAGVGRPQELITQQTLEKFRESLVLVIGIMDQRFGSPSGIRESGTEEEFECAVENKRLFGFPEVKWFFRDRKKLEFSADDPDAAMEQWKKVRSFRARVEQEKEVFYRTYADLAAFSKLLEEDLGQWLNRPDQPWFVTPQPSPKNAAKDWPAHILERLSRELNDAFFRHMQSGEEISPAQARSRYVEGVLSLHLTRDIGSEGAGSTQTTPNEGPLEDFLEAGDMRLLVVSPGGGGKTTMLRHAAAEGAARALLNPEAPAFIYVRLASFDRDKDGFEGLKDLLSVAAGIDREGFESYWREGTRPIVIFLDGLNEVAHEYRATCSRAIGTLLQNSRSGRSYVITSRPGSDLESMAADPTENCGLRVADLLNFGPSQVEEYLAAQGVSELQEQITGQLCSLATSPFLLWALTRTLLMSGVSAPDKGTYCVHQARLRHCR